MFAIGQDKNIKTFVTNQKSIYGAATEDKAFAHLMEFKETAPFYA